MADLGKSIEEAVEARDRMKARIEKGAMNSVLLRGEITHCLQLEDSIGCWGWIQVNDETAIGFKAYGDKGLRLLDVMRSGSSKRVILMGELVGKPAEISVEYWMIS